MNMPKTKKELVADILSYEKVDTETNLMKKTVKELESILDEVSTVKKESNSDVSPSIDMEALMAKMKAEMMAELKEQARKEVEEELKENESELPKAPKAKVEIDRFKPIPVMNVTHGTLVYYSKRSGAEWTWTNYGDVEYIEFQELLTIRSSQRKFIDEPFFVILDEDVINYMGLDKAYANFDKEQIQSLDKIFRFKQGEFEEAIENLPKGIQHSVVMRARELHSLGELDSFKKINYINEKFKTDIGQRG